MFFIFVTIILPIASLYIYSEFCNHSYMGKLLRIVPGPKLRFIFGNTFEIFRTPENLFQFARSIRKYGSISRTYGFNIAGIHIYDPKDLEVILSSTKYNNKGIPYSFMKCWLGNGLLLSNGEHWAYRRKLLTPAFHFSILKNFLKVFIEQTEVLTNAIAKGNGDNIEIQPLVMKYTLRVMCETALGTRMNENIDKVSKKYFEAIHTFIECFLYRFARLWMYIDFVYKLSYIGTKCRKTIENLQVLTNQIIKERKEYRRDNNIVCMEDDVQAKNKPALLDLLLDEEARGKINEDGVREEVDTFTFEGHDTTAMALTFMILTIANEPHVQTKIYAEMEQIFGTSDRTPTAEDLAKMEYLGCCIKESLRLYPSVPFITRLIKEDVILGGYKIPANTVCCIHIFDIHRDEKYFPDPEKFDPERFFPENSATRPPYTYIPFSAGPRNCIGQKFAMMLIKVLISSLIRKYRLEAVTRRTDLQFIGDLVLRVKNPIYVRFVPR